ncbi:hypothetical protein JWG45_08735, partial [Leptospira sp. 201903070]
MFKSEGTFLKEFVVPPTLFRERRGPHPDWVEEAGSREKIERLPSITEFPFFQEESSTSTFVVPPTLFRERRGPHPDWVEEAGSR